MIRTFKYKLVPNKAQRVALSRNLDVCRELFNISLEQRRMQKIHPYEQMRQLTELRAAFPEYKGVYVKVLQNVITRLHRSFENMWARGAGYPRFKSYRRYNSFQFGNAGYALNGNRLSISKVGNVKLHLSRPIPTSGTVKTLTIKRTVNGWFALLAVDVPAEMLPESSLSVGIDLGIEQFAATSNGEFIENPRFYKRAQSELRRAQRRVARRRKGSNRRRRAVVLLQKVHDRIQARRLDWTHKQALSIVRRFGTIVLEDLNVKGLAQGILSKQVNDVGWSQFKSILSEKAEKAGRRVVEINPAYTSQDCPACGARKKKKLSERRHECPCGYSAHRDTAAAINILGRIDPLGANVGRVAHA